MNQACMDFGKQHLSSIDIKGKRVLEVGSMNVNGTLRHIVEKLDPQDYIGVDLSAGNCVDKVLDVEDIVSEFGKGSFDVVICTEMLEHCKKWESAINNMKDVLVVGGHILLTARSPGFQRHGYPDDFWRFTTSNMEAIFSDFDIIKVDKDPALGVLVFAKKTSDLVRADLSCIQIMSMK